MNLPEYIDVDGVMRPTTNCLGLPIARGEKSLINFWRWFGNSKIVDLSGRPIVVLHGTNKPFTRFSKSKATQGIFWFTTDRSAIEKNDVGAAGNGVILQFYAKIDAPADWKQYDRLMLAQFKSEKLDGGFLTRGGCGFDGFVFEPAQLRPAGPPILLPQPAAGLRKMSP